MPHDLAITYTVKNESRLLLDNIQYHREMGVRRFYVFWDETSDNAPELVKKFPEVRAFNCIRPEDVDQSPSWMPWIRANWDDWMDLRKMLNMWWAAHEAAREGIEWLAAIDPDELIIGDERARICAGAIEKMLSLVPTWADQILMPNLDVVTTKVRDASAFHDYRYFFRRLPRKLEWFWRYSRGALQIFGLSPRRIAWYDHFLFRSFLRSAFPRVMRDPQNREVIPTGYFLSYSNHKSMIRASQASRFRPLIHGWINAGRGAPKPRSVRLGNVLHYDLLDADYFMAKFRQRPPTTNVSDFYVRSKFSDIAHRQDVEVYEFFSESVVISEQSRLDELVEKKIVERIDSVANYFSSNPMPSDQSATTLKCLQ